MPNPWAAVDDLMRELGSIRRAAIEIEPSVEATAAIERAIKEAAEAVELTIDAPTSPQKLMAARDALGVAEEVILALDAEGRPVTPRALPRPDAESPRRRADRANRRAGTPPLAIVRPCLGRPARAIAPLLPVEVGIGPVQPVLADGTEHVDVDGVLEGLGAVGDVRRDHHHLP
jgi:hypothetical protein